MAATTVTTSEAVLDLGMTLGEGPRWFGSTLHWVDIEAGVHWHWRQGDERPTPTQHDRRITAVAPSDRGTVVLVDDAVELHAPAGARQTVTVPGIDATRTRLNDARADARGRLWFGTLSRGPRTDDEGLYCLDAGKVRRARGGISLSNGIAFSPDQRTMYHADTLNHVVTASAYDLDRGHLALPETFLDLDDELPDGIATDADGGVWVAIWGGGRVERFDAAGRRTASVQTPGADLTTAVCLGDPDLRTLYVTTATDGEPGHGTHAGALYRARVAIPGLPEAPVRWREAPR